MMKTEVGARARERMNTDARAAATEVEEEEEVIREGGERRTSQRAAFYAAFTFFFSFFLSPSPLLFLPPFRMRSCAFRED